MKRRTPHVLPALILLATMPFSHVVADVVLPTVLGSHMVLQRDAAVPICGEAAPGEAVRVGIAEQIHETVADTNGAWRVTLDPMDASFAPIELTVTASNSLVLTNILVGEVWLCSGQSNMQWPLSRVRDGDVEIASASNPAMRLFQVDRKTVLAPRVNVNGSWQSCSPDAAKGFSGVGYLFGRDLQPILGVPVGLIDSSWGGTPAEAWTRLETLSESEPMQVTLEQWETRLAGHEASMKTWQLAADAWQAKKAAGEKVGRHPRKPGSPLNPHRPGILADSMLAPIVPFAIKGSIWYQGESNASRHEQYRTLLPLMIADWREWWGIDNLAFGIVQLAGFRQPKELPSDDTWPHLRDAQLHTHRTTPHTGLAVITDIGESNNIHPGNKSDVGRRLARWALTDVYGLEFVGSGPMPCEHSIEGGKVTITFDHVDKGLKIMNGGDPMGFTLAGDDAVWHPATATLTNKKTIVLSSDAVPMPVAARYAWQNNPIDANVFNSSTLPLTPFRTDAWPKDYVPVVADESEEDIGNGDSLMEKSGVS